MKDDNFIVLSGYGIVFESDTLVLLALLTDKIKFTHYYAFCAIVVLYVHTIQRRFDPPHTWRESFLAAEKCQAQLSSFVEKTSFPQRYGIVLEELRLEAVKQTQKGQSAEASSAPIDMSFSVPEMSSGTTSTNFMAEITGWGEFDSLVCV